MPRYTIFAGINGAGKTSIYNSIYYSENKDEKRITNYTSEGISIKWRDKNIPNWATNILN
jgi:predicted ABC-type ATPase